MPNHWNHAAGRENAILGEDYEVESVSIEDYDINLNNVSKEIIVGPKNKVMKDIDSINSEYLCRSWIAGNKSRLPILNPIGITPAFNWKRGYKQTIIECINTRFHQYEKLNGDLGLILERRPSRMERDKKYFIERIVNIDNSLRQLRKDGVNFHNQVEKAGDTIDKIKEILATQYKQCLDFINNSVFKDKIDIDMYISYPLAKTEYLEKSNFEKHGVDVIKWQRSVLCFDVWFKDFDMEVQTGEGELLGKVPLQENGIHFAISLEPFVNDLQRKDLTEMDTSRYGGNYYRHGRRSAPVYSDAAGFISYVSSYNWTAYWPKTKVQAYRETGKELDYSTYDGLLHPFYNRSANYNHIGSAHKPFKKWLGDNQNWEALTGICFGNLETEVGNHLMKLDLVGLLITLQLWCRFTIGATGPLNSIGQSILGMPGEYSTQFKSAVGKDLNQNAFQQTSVFVSEFQNELGVPSSWLMPHFVLRNSNAYRQIRQSDNENILDEVYQNRLSVNREGQFGQNSRSDYDYDMGIENLIWLETHGEVDPGIILESEYMVDEYVHDDYDGVHDVQMHVMSYDIFDKHWKLNKYLYWESKYYDEYISKIEERAGEWTDEEKAELGAKYEMLAEIAFKETAISFAYAYTEYSDSIECQFRDKCHWYRALKYLVDQLESGEISDMSYIEMLNSKSNETSDTVVEEPFETEELTFEQLETLENEQHNTDLSENEEDEIANQMRTWVAGMRGGRNG